MAVGGRAEIATASIEAVGDQDRVDGSTHREAAINVVTKDERKMLSRSGQNGTWSGPGAANSPGADGAPPAKSGGPSHPGTSTERGKPVTLPTRDSDPRGSPTGRRVQDGGASERRPVIGRIGVEPSGDITPPARAPTSPGSPVTREPRPTDSGSKADLTRAATPAGAAPGQPPDWNSINWRRVWRVVRRL